MYLWKHVIGIIMSNVLTDFGPVLSVVSRCPLPLVIPTERLSPPPSQEHLQVHPSNHPHTLLRTNTYQELLLRTAPLHCSRHRPHVAFSEHEHMQRQRLCRFLWRRQLKWPFQRSPSRMLRWSTNTLRRSFFSRNKRVSTVGRVSASWLWLM